MRTLPDMRGVKLALLWAMREAGLPTGLATRALLRGQVGRGLRVGRGSCVIGRELSVGRNVRVGRNTDVAAESVLIEDDVAIGSNVTIRCRKLVLRKGSRIDDGSRIYGIATPRSSFELGRNAWIFSSCHINTDEAVKIGARSAAGGHCLIFTHSSYLPVTHGYPALFAPVTIGDDVWLPWHAFVLPGATIGRGAVVAAFSVVSGDVPEYSFAMGVPARVLRDAKNYRQQLTDEAMLDLCERITQSTIDATAAAFRPRTLFFPDARSASRVGPGCWEIADAGSTVRVVLLPRHGGDVSPYVSELQRTLFLTAGATQPPLPECNWCDLVTQRSTLPLSVPPLMREIMGRFSNQGLRFDCHADEDESPA